MEVLQTSSDSWQTGQKFKLSLPFIQHFTEFVNIMSGQMLDRTA